VEKETMARATRSQPEFESHASQHRSLSRMKVCYEPFELVWLHDTSMGARHAVELLNTKSQHTCSLRSITHILDHHSYSRSELIRGMSDRDLRVSHLCLELNIGLNGCNQPSPHSRANAYIINANSSSHPRSSKQPRCYDRSNTHIIIKIK
jgi:hypothetical protein